MNGKTVTTVETVKETLTEHIDALTSCTHQVDTDDHVFVCNIALVDTTGDVGVFQIHEAIREHVSQFDAVVTTSDMSYSTARIDVRIPSDNLEIEEREPTFEIYDGSDLNSLHRDEDGFMDMNDSEIEFVEPVKTFNSWENASDYLERFRGDANLMWRELGPLEEHTLCQTCGQTVHTNSDERLDDLRYMHHVGTGH